MTVWKIQAQPKLAFFPFIFEFFSSKNRVFGRSGKF